MVEYADIPSTLESEEEEFQTRLHSKTLSIKKEERRGEREERRQKKKREIFYKPIT